MIRRRDGQHLFLIDQDEHARLAGRLARHVGNGAFGVPIPFEPVIAAISRHDCGWVHLDQNPPLNPDGFPAHVFEIGIEIALDAWTQTVEQVAGIHPYANLLVSMHVMHLAAMAATNAAAAATRSRAESFHLNRFLHRQIEIQESLRRRLGMHTDLPLRLGLAEPVQADEEDLLRANFYLMEFMDVLSLAVCFDEIKTASEHDLWPRTGGGPVKVRIERESAARFSVNPWPFDAEEIEATVVARQMPADPSVNGVNWATESTMAIAAQICKMP